MASVWVQVLHYPRFNRTQLKLIRFRVYRRFDLRCRCNRNSAFQIYPANQFDAIFTMWALRRASASRRVRYCLGSKLCFIESVTSLGCLDGGGFSSVLECPRIESGNFLMSNKSYHSGRSHCPSGCGVRCRHCFSSQAGVEGSGKEEGDVDDGLFELDAPKLAASDLESGLDDVVATSDSELSDDDNDEVDVIKGSEDLDSIPTEGDIKTKRERSGELFNAIFYARRLSIGSAVDKYVKDGNELNSTVIAEAMRRLRRNRLFGRALQLSEWMEKNKAVEFDQKEYATRLDLIIKLHGIPSGESYINSIPDSFRVEIIYRTLLANCVALNNGNKAEEIFNKMRNLGFPLSAFSYNQLLLLYMKTDKRKIADVLLLMEKENVKPNPFTYKILIDTKGQLNDIDGMEKIVQTMKSEGIDPDLFTLSVMARHYVKGGVKDKAIDVLKQMESDDLKANRYARSYLLPLYASLGDANEVKRIWEACESDPRPSECMSAIEAWGRLKNIDEAECIFEKMSKSRKRLSAKHYTAMLRVYAENKMLAKGKELVNKMGENGCTIGPYTWDTLVKLYVNSGETEKADAILQKAIERRQFKPMFSSYMHIMGHYSMKGDVHNTEKIFHRLRQAGYVSRISPFQSLAEAYIKSKTPAYGMLERLKADNIFPNKPLAAKLAQIDPFKKTAVSDLLD